MRYGFLCVFFGRIRTQRSRPKGVNRTSRLFRTTEPACGWQVQILSFFLSESEFRRPGQLRHSFGRNWNLPAAGRL